MDGRGKRGRSDGDEKALPQSLDAERCVLGAAMVDRGALLRAQAVLGEDAAGKFFFGHHRAIWRAMEALTAGGKELDSMLLIAELEARGWLERAGGVAYAASIGDGVPKVSNVEHYAAIVREKALRREVVHAAHEVQQQALEGEEAAEEIISRAVSSFLQIGKGMAGARMHEWSTAVAGAMETALGEVLAEPGQAPAMRLRFGIEALDKATSGLRRGDVALIVGQTSHGKSLLAEQLWANADEGGALAQVYSAEMSKEALATRALAHRGKFPMWYLRKPEEALGHTWRGQTVTREWLKEQLLRAAVEELGRKVRVMDAGITPEVIWSFARLQKQESGLDLIIVDYDQLVVREGVRRAKARGEWRKLADSEFEEQAEFMTRALELAKPASAGGLDLCFVLLCQPRKVSEEVARGQRAPRTEEIFGSSSVANTAHHILWIVRHFFQHLESENRKKFERAVTIYHLKARNGMAGVVKSEFDPEMVLFREAPPEMTA